MLLVKPIVWWYSSLCFSKGHFKAKYLNFIDLSGNYSLHILNDLQAIFLCRQIDASCVITNKENYKTEVHMRSLESEHQKMPFKEI